MEAVTIASVAIRVVARPVEEIAVMLVNGIALAAKGLVGPLHQPALASGPLSVVSE